LKRSDGKLLISPSSALKNINASKRTLPLHDVFVKVWQTAASDPNKQNEGPGFQIQGDPLPWNQAHKLGGDGIRVDTFGFNEKSPLWGWQVFTWRTPPIKQIDAIARGGQSARTTFQEFRPLKEEEAAPGQQTQAPANTSAPQQVGSGIMGGGGPPGGGGKMAALGGGAAGTDRSKSADFNPKRYVQVTPQVRRIPVGIA